MTINYIDVFFVIFIGYIIYFLIDWSIDHHKFWKSSGYYPMKKIIKEKKDV